MANAFYTTLCLGYNPLFGRGNPIPHQLEKIFNFPESVAFHLGHIGPGFYEISIVCVNIRGARHAFDHCESIKGTFGSWHRLTYGQKVHILEEKDEGLAIMITD